MKVSLGCDHGGFAMKEHVKGWLEAHGYEVQDCGCYSTEKRGLPRLWPGGCRGGGLRRV